MHHRYFLLCILLLSASSVTGQPLEATLLYQWNDPSIPGTSFYDNAYNEVWGVVANGHEIAVIGSTLGTHFIDVTDPVQSEVLEEAFVPGAAQGTSIIHRDFHDYAGYLYAVSDEGASTLQIIDLSYLPDSTVVVYDSNTLIRRSHNIFIDSSSARLYACGGSAPSTSFFLRILSLDDPTAPTLLASFPNASLQIPYVHDAYVRHDTAYLNCGTSGLFVVDFSDPTTPITLGVLEDYPQAGYNHSGWLSDDGRYYYMGDETHARDLKVLDMQDLADIQVVNVFNAGSSEPYTIPHNLLVHGQMLFVSYYYDGLQVYDLSDPAKPARIYYYDTFSGPSQASYEGAWGVFPFLPSGNVLLSDMQTGLYVFEKMDAISQVQKTDGTPEISFQVMPQPVQSILTVTAVWPQPTPSVQLTLFDLQGRPCWSEVRPTSGLRQWETTLSLPADLSNGMYVLQMRSGAWVANQKLVIQR